MPEKYEQSKVYPAKANSVFRLCLSAIESTGARIAGHDINFGTINAERPTNLGAWGQRIFITIAPLSPAQTNVTIACTTMNIMDDVLGHSKKENRERTAKFFQALDFMVERAVLAGE